MGGLWMSEGDSPFRGGHAGLPSLVQKQEFEACFWEALPCRSLSCLSAFLYQLLDYVMTALLFSDKNVDSNLITWNRVVLLHGEVGGFSCNKKNGLELICNLHLFLLQYYSSLCLKESKLFLNIPHLWHRFNSLKSGKFASWLSFREQIVCFPLTFFYIKWLPNFPSWT